MLKPRIIKSVKCDHCHIYLKQLAAQKYDHLIYDADLPENTKELDDWKINAMPVIQIVDVKENGTQEMIHQFPPGPFSPRIVNAKIKALNKEREKKK